MWATSNDINLNDWFLVLGIIEYRGTKDGDYHLLSPLLKIHIHIHDRLHERNVVPCSMLVGGNLQTEVLFPLNLPCPPKNKCEAHFFRFPSIAAIHRFFVHPQRDDNFDEKVISYPICPRLVQKYAFLRGAVMAVRS